MWDSTKGNDVDASDLADELIAVDDVEGITFLGGEPFDQAVALSTVAERLQAVGRSVMTFTGHRLEDLLSSQEPGVADLLSHTDLLVDGQYVASAPDRERAWVGSTNQRFHFLSERYAHLAATLTDAGDAVEIRLRPDGSVFLNGFASASALSGLRRAVLRPPRP